MFKYVKLVRLPGINCFRFVTGIRTDSPTVWRDGFILKIFKKFVNICECEELFEEDKRKKNIL